MYCNESFPLIYTIVFCLLLCPKLHYSSYNNIEEIFTVFNKATISRPASSLLFALCFHTFILSLGETLNTAPSSSFWQRLMLIIESKWADEKKQFFWLIKWKKNGENEMRHKLSGIRRLSFVCSAKMEPNIWFPLHVTETLSGEGENRSCVSLFAMQATIFKSCYLTYIK